MPDRDLLGDSLNFDVPLAACNGTVRLRAVIELPGAIGQPPLSWSTSSIVVSFTPKPPQEILPILITDPASTSPPPAMADLFTNLSGPAGAHPFPENGFANDPGAIARIFSETKAGCCGSSHPYPVGRRSREHRVAGRSGISRQERRPSFDEIRWSSSLDGYVGQGAQLIAILSPGDHTITATMRGASTDISLSVAAP